MDGDGRIMFDLNLALHGKSCYAAGGSWVERWDGMGRVLCEPIYAYRHRFLFVLQTLLQVMLGRRYLQKPRPVAKMIVLALQQ